MISYRPFYQTLLKKNVTEYYQINHQDISSGTLHNMRQGKHISFATLDALCFILDCPISDILEYVKDEA